MDTADRGKCVKCKHVERSHDPECRCGCAWFREATKCPLGHAAHNAPRGHTCNCVPGQIDLLDLA